MSTKRNICLSLEVPLIERIDELAATMHATRTWTVCRLLDAALDPGGLHSPAAGSAGNPPPGIGPVAAGRGHHLKEPA